MSARKPSPTLLRASIGALLALVLLPGTALLTGSALGASAAALEGDDQISRWRDARLALRISRLSPLFWSAAAAREDSLDHRLSSAYFVGAIDGTSAEPDEHLRFLQSRAAAPRWRAEWLATRIRYGQTDDVLSAARDSDADIAVAAALAAGDRAALSRWLPLASEAPDALRLIAGQPVAAPTTDDPLAGFLYAESLRRQGDASTAAPLLDALRTADAPIGGLAHAAWMLALPDQTTPPASADDISLMAGWLLAAGRAPSSEAAQAAIDGALRCAEGALPSDVLTYRFLGAPYLPHPAHFDGAIAAASGEARHRLLLLQARAALQGLEIARAQSALKALPAEPLSEDLEAERLMLRVVARELAADLPGAQKYALQGEDIPRAAHKMVFKLQRARLLLAGAQGEEERNTALGILDGLGNYPLTPELRAERDALLGLTIQQTGEQEPFTLGGVPAPADLYVDDAAFRLWFARYVDRIASTPQPTAALAALRYWRAANQRGEFLIEARLGDTVSPHSALIRAHLQFARRRLLDGDSDGWSHFTDVRALVADEPFRALLPHTAMPLPFAPDLDAP